MRWGGRVSNDRAAHRAPRPHRRHSRKPRNHQDRSRWRAREKSRAPRCHHLRAAHPAKWNRRGTAREALSADRPGPPTAPGNSFVWRSYAALVPGSVFSFVPVPPTLIHSTSLTSCRSMDPDVITFAAVCTTIIATIGSLVAIGVAARLLLMRAKRLSERPPLEDNRLRQLQEAVDAI